MLENLLVPYGFLVVFANNIAGSCTESMLLRVVVDDALCCASSGGTVHCLDVDLDEHGLVDLLAAQRFECHAGCDLQLFPLFGDHPKHYL